MLHPVRRPTYFPSAAEFDGSTNIKAGAGITGAADSKLFFTYGWFKCKGAASTTRTLAVGVTALNGATIRWQLRVSSGDRLNFVGLNAAGSTICDVRSLLLIPPSDIWHHFAISVDLNAASQKAQMLMDGKQTVLTSTGGITLTDDSIDFTNADTGVGGTPSGAQRWTGGLADLALFIGIAPDIYNPAIRRALITDRLEPVSPGSDGSTPADGTAPAIFLSLAAGDAASVFATNKGTGGNFGTTTGTLALSTAPARRALMAA